MFRHWIPLSALLALSLLACSDPREGRVDRDPEVRITSPKTSDSASYTLTATASDDVGVSALSYTLNGDAPVPVTPVASPIDVALTLTEGDNPITVSAKDGAGNEGSDQITVTYDPDAQPEAPGALTVTVSGLPVGEEADVTVLVPGVYVRDVTETTTLEDLTPGAYIIQARNVSTGNGEYVANPPQRHVIVEADKTATAAVSYTRQNAELGSLALTISGLPAGGAAEVTVEDPLGYSRQLTASQTLLDLAPGDYIIGATEVTVDTNPYTPDPETQTVTVAAEQTTRATVTYNGPETGGLELSIRGLPANLAAGVTVGSTVGFSETVSETRLLSDLEPGSYTITAEAVQGNSDTYLPTESEQRVTVKAAETTFASVAYEEEEADTGSLSLFIGGLKEGARADVTVRHRSGGPRRKVRSSTTLYNLPVGDYTITAAEVVPDSATFIPDESSQTVEIKVNEVTQANVDYSCATVKPPDFGLEEALRDTFLIDSGPVSCTAMGMLTRLDADGYDISDPKLEGLQYAVNLQGLYLGSNDLSELADEVFSALTNLQDLFLDDNAFTTLPQGLFSGLTSLQTLYLGDNQLATLPNGIFSDLPNLESLDLESNVLTTLPKETFSGLTSLSTLDLSDNQLNSLSDGLFSELTSLQDLDLDGNQLTTLPRYVFADLTNLRTLRLDDNRLNTLAHAYFSGLQDLQSLELQDNCLRLNRVPVAGVLVELSGPTPFTSNNPRSDVGCPAVGAIRQGFERNAEGWTVDGTKADWHSDGYLSASGSSDGYFTSPGPYVGDASAYLWRTLQFDLRQSSSTGLPTNVCAVQLESDIATLCYDLPTLPGGDWTSYTIPLDASAGWLDDDDDPASERLIRDVLTDLMAVKIRWRYNAAPDATGDLDNVTFGAN